MREVLDAEFVFVLLKVLAADVMFFRIMRMSSGT